MLTATKIEKLLKTHGHVALQAMAKSNTLNQLRGVGPKTIQAIHQHFSNSNRPTGRFLVFDFETTGDDKDSENNYKPYSRNVGPLPYANHPTELAAAVVEDGKIVDTTNIVICGAIRMSPWVIKNVTHLSVDRCDVEGIPFSEALESLAQLIGNQPTTLVAHNMEYDYNNVLIPAVKYYKLEDSTSFKRISTCPRYCTMINDNTKANKTAYFWKKIQAWRGPTLFDLAVSHGVTVDIARRHQASYDVEITTQCLCKSNGWNGDDHDDETTNVAKKARMHAPKTRSRASARAVEVAAKTDVICNASELAAQAIETLQRTNENPRPVAAPIWLPTRWPAGVGSRSYYDECGDPFDPNNQANWDGNQQVGFRD